MTVPTADGCFGSGQVLFAWIGLGGTTNSGYDLVQEGVECDDYGPGSNLPATGAMHPFREWAGTYAPQDLCGIPKNVYGGETMYDSISYDTINGKAYFYMENVGAGTGSGQLIGKCWVDKPKPPANWHFDGNTADYEVEVATKKQQPLSFNVSPISFSGADLQWTSDSDRWVPFGSRPTTKTYDGVQNSDGSLGPYCEGPSKIGSDQESFTVTESDGACHQNWTTAGS